MIFIEENSSTLWNLIEEAEGFFTLSEIKIDFSNITTLNIFDLLMHNSFKYKKINENIYIDLNNRGQKIEYELNDYKIINERYFYSLDEIVNFIEG